MRKKVISEIEPYVVDVLTNTKNWEDRKMPILDIMADHDVQMTNEYKMFLLNGQMAKPDLNEGTTIEGANDGSEIEFYSVIKSSDSQQDTMLELILGPYCFTFANVGDPSNGAFTLRGEDISDFLEPTIWDKKLVDITVRDEVARENINKFNVMQNA